MRNRGLLDPLVLLPVLFRLFRCEDKNLRQFIYEHIIADLKGMNENKKNEKVNRKCQALMYKILEEDENGIAAKKSLQVMIDLYRRRVWTDSRTINVIAKATLSDVSRIFVPAHNFFLGIEQKMLNDDNEDYQELVQKAEAGIKDHSHSRKRASREHDTARRLKKRKKALNSKNNVKEETALFAAIELINDPTGIAEKLFKKLKKSNDGFELKLLRMNFLSRLIGQHSLFVLNFYSFIQRYLNSHQQSVTQILAYLIQACHDLVPPDELVVVMKNIANNFITERCSGEIIAVGLNSIREMIMRVPSILSEPDMDDFIQDLVMYGKHREKTVMMAGRTFLNTIRELYPSLLKGKEGH